MKITDGKKIAEITMQEWNGKEWGLDWSLDFFEAGKLPYNEEADTYIVENVDYCIEQAFDWEECEGDFADDGGADPENRKVEISKIRCNLKWTWFDTSSWSNDWENWNEKSKLLNGIPELYGGWMIETEGNPITKVSLEDVDDYDTIRAIEAYLNDDSVEWYPVGEDETNTVDSWLKSWGIK